MSARIPLEGRRFGRWTVLEFRGANANGQTTYRCKCDCADGTIKDVVAQTLRKGLTLSCGCMKGQAISFARTVHGQSKCAITGTKETRAYRTWVSMHRRCNGTTTSGKKYYVDRGITVCERWKSFENFLADMGEPPLKRSIDRMDNDRGYSPDNCRWATAKEQSINRRPHGTMASDSLAQRLKTMSDQELRKLFDGCSIADIHRLARLINLSCKSRQPRLFVVA